jgi:hypothetical protein
MTSALQPGSTAPVPANCEAALAELESLVAARQGGQLKVREDGELKPWPKPK